MVIVVALAIKTRFACCVNGVREPESRSLWLVRRGMEGQQERSLRPDERSLAALEMI